MNLLKKTKLVLPVFIITSIVVSFLLYNNDQRIFTRLSQNLFIGEMASNTLNMHYTIAFPENYGIDYTPRLNIYDPHNTSNNPNEQEELIAALEQLSPARLTRQDTFTYNLLLSYLYQKRTGNLLSLYEEPFSPGSGIQTALPILLADYNFRSATDVEDYLTILNQIDDLLNGLVLFEQEKSESGLFMSDRTVDKVIEQCDRIMDKETLLSGNHFLQSTFKERMDVLEKNQSVTPAQKENYIAHNNRLLATVVQPAYERTGDQLFLLRGSGTNDKGLSYFPKGRDYYQYLVKSATGSDRSIDEIKKMLFQDFLANFEAVSILAQDHPELANDIRNGIPELPVTEPSAIMQSLQENITDHYPSLPSVIHAERPVCTIKNVSSSMEPYSSPAYYLTPPIDRYYENTIYINQVDQVNSLALYTTLAHEGYPGHLYQSVYHRMYMEKTNGNPLRYILHYGGYLEGWALYVEMDSFRYAKELIADRSPETVYLYDYYQLTRSLQLGLYSLIDISIHYDGADFAQVQQLLAIIGINDPQLARNIYEYILDEPANYLMYYQGYLEILELKKEARNYWGSLYSDPIFHQFYLEAGPADFSNLRALLAEAKITKNGELELF